MFIGKKNWSGLKNLIAAKAASGGAAPIPYDGYVQDGLIFRLDGIRKGGVSGKWIDVVRGLEFVQSETGITEAEDGFVFDNGYFLRDAADVSSDYTKETIEICIRRQQTNQSYMVLYGGTGIGFAYGSGATNFSISTLRDPPEYVWPMSSHTESIQTISVNVDNCRCNGAKVSKGSSTNYWSNQLDKVSIGARVVTTTPRSFIGTIHAIRIYNRKLTVDEMLANQRVDNERFNLGLTI